MRVAQVIADFLAWNTRHRSPKTVRFYQQRLKLFGAKFGDREFCPRRPDQVAGDGITSLEIDEYLHEAGHDADGVEWTSTTRRHNAVALETLQSWAIRTAKVLPRDQRIFEPLEKPRAQCRERIPTAEEIEAIKAQASPAFLQIYEALCQTGARPGELCSLTVEHIDWEKRLITLTEHKTARKTGKARLIPIGQKFEAMLKTAIGGRAWGHVFRNSRGKPWQVNALSAAFRAYRDRAKLSDDLVLYLARHRFGTQLASKKLDIKTIADLMGHANVSTTQRYIHRDTAELAGDQDVIE